MNLPPSVEAYASYIDTTKQAVTDTYAADDNGLVAAQKLLHNAHRIFFSGSGSSLPAALAGQQLLAKYSDVPAICAPSSLLLDDPHFVENDVVVLVSQGWHRADAALITQKVLRSKVRLVVITGRPDRVSEYTQDENEITTVSIYPTTEKIFCRPATAVTGYIKVVQLVAPLIDKEYSLQAWLDAYEAGRAQEPSDIAADKQYVVLASGLLLPASNNIALSLREGAGRHGTLQEIESYGHGMYVSDQLHRDQIHYIALGSESDTHTTEALKRIQPLLEKTNSSHEIWIAPGDAIVGNVTHMARIAQTVLQSIRSDGFDMNNPPGMEENRSFHEVMA